MKFAIMGSGGIGAYYGALLAKAGIETHFIARGDHLAAMRKSGLQVASPTSGFHLEQVNATDDPSDIGPVDCVLFATKLWDVPTAGNACKPLIGPDTAVISLHNGVTAEQELAEILGDQHILGGVAEITSFLDGPGSVSMKGDFCRIRFGELDGSTPPRAQKIYDALTTAGIEAELSTDINRLLWLKFMMIVGSSNMTSLTRSTIGPIREDPGTRDLFERCCAEVIAVGQAEGANLHDDDLADRLTFVDRLPVNMTASMANDLDLGKRLELDWFAGHVVRLGAAHNIPTPINAIAYNLLKLNKNGRDGQ